LEVHKLVNGKYELQVGNPVWLPEIGLGIGCDRGNYCGVIREWLYWYDQSGKRYPTPQEKIQLVEKRAELAEKRAQQMAERLRSLGIDPDQLD
jgi:hypothetical protein